jgi:hypothetical protein
MERAICDEAKVAEHSRYKCWHCRKKIEKGMPVVRKGEAGKFGYQSHSLCYECAEMQLARDRETVKELIETNDKLLVALPALKETCKKAILLSKLAPEEKVK